ncbi:hypothetical protein [Nitratidesulfovibrio sp. 1201_IL3209]|uniref:hypothetical protein n=1 Tax=Nitratidesulfovibrio sp. 1201_IL3209 TaxID=3084053 RepID=UPI002FDA6BBB
MTISNVVLTIFFGLILLALVVHEKTSSGKKRGAQRKQNLGPNTRQPARPAPHPELEGMRITCKSSTDADVQYTLDVNNQTCTCPDWSKRRSAYPKNNPCRLCKHLNVFFEETGVALPAALKPFEDMICHFAFDDSGIPIGEKTEALVIGHPDGAFEPVGHLAVRKSMDSEWVNIYTSSLDYGYNIVERRWAYGNEPEFAQDLLDNMDILKPDRS